MREALESVITANNKEILFQTRWKERSDTSSGPLSFTHVPRQARIHFSSHECAHICNIYRDTKDEM